MTTQQPAPQSIAEALANAQREILDPPRSAWNPHFKTRYADLCTVLQSVRPVLARHGIALVQATQLDDQGRMVLVTRLLWGSSEQIASYYPVTPQQNTPQGMGAALTYARRYALAALVGVASDDDDDGNAASADKPAKAAKAREVEPKTAAAADMIERIRKIDDLDELVALKTEVQAAGPAAQAAWVARGKHLRERASQEAS